MSETERNVYRTRALQRVREKYDWSAVTRQYETLLANLRKPGPAKMKQA